MALNFKDGAEPVSSSEPHYDLFDGGYISPNKLLEPEDAERVNDAVALIHQFLEEAEDNGLLEIS